jgi:hypothetical protein
VALGGWALVAVAVAVAVGRLIGANSVVTSFLTSPLLLEFVAGSRLPNSQAAFIGQATQALFEVGGRYRRNM